MESIALKILNLNAIVELEEENERLQDIKEKEIRRRLIDEIWYKISDYDAHIFEFNYNEYMNKLSERGIGFVPIEKELVSEQWDALFSSLVSEDTKRNKKHYSDQFKWHLFSFELLPATYASAAQEDFDAQIKDTLYMFFQYAREAYLIKDAYLLKADDLNVLGEFSTMEKADMYVFNPSAKWTYVKTHEASCGPYFFCAK